MGAPSGGWQHCAAAATFAQAGGWEQQCAAAGTYQAGGWEASVPGASYAPAVEYLPQGQVEVGGVVFLCDPRTEDECLQRRLLGMPASQVRARARARARARTRARARARVGAGVGVS